MATDLRPGGLDILYTFPLADGTNGQVLVTDGAGTVTWATVSTANIYTADGALTANRSVDLDSFTLTFSDGIFNCFGRGSVATNTGIGQTFNASTTGANNTAVGYTAGQAITTAVQTTFIGVGAGKNYATGFSSVAVGYQAAAAINGVNGVTSIGTESLTAATGQYNTALGARAGYNVTSGQYNIHIGGHNAGSGVTTGSYNTIIGLVTGLANPSNNVILADGQGNRAVTKDASHNVAVGNLSVLATTATDGFLHIPTCAGTPTGTPTAITGKAPIVIDTTNNKMYIYSGGAWVVLN